MAQKAPNKSSKHQQNAIVAIDEAKQISAYTDLVSSKEKSYADQVLEGKHCQLSKTQIVALQSIYLETLEQVYK